MVLVLGKVGFEGFMKITQPKELGNDGEEADGERKGDGGILPVDDGVRVFVGVGVAVVW